MNLHKYIAPDYGLCNRLRGYVGATAYARKMKTTLHVVWEESPACPYRIQDLFEPLQATQFISEDISNVKYVHISSNVHRLEDILGRYKLPVGQAGLLIATLTPIRPIRERIQQLYNKIPLHNALGFHIRRTDHIDYANSCGGSTPLETFWALADKYPTKPIFIACDNSDTLELCRVKYGPRIHSAKEFTSSSTLRQTDGIHTVLDLYCLALCEHFQGSMHSSFTEFVDYLRNTWITHSSFKRKLM